MASKVFPPYTTTEAQNLALGQAGAIFIDDTGDERTTIKNGVIIAITVLEEATFTNLLSEDDHNGYDAWPNTASGAYNDGTEVGDNITTATGFPAGITIYGRWTGLQLSDGAVIAYIGN